MATNIDRTTTRSTLLSVWMSSSQRSLSLEPPRSHRPCAAASPASARWATLPAARHCFLPAGTPSPSPTTAASTLGCPPRRPRPTPARRRLLPGRQPGPASPAGLFVEAQVWRDVAQSNEAAANALRGELQSVLDAQQARCHPGGAAMFPETTTPRRAAAARTTSWPALAARRRSGRRRGGPLMWFTLYTMACF
ncbi:hypothetical protein ACP4OV_013249 [Aristida adscensionis]